MRSRNTIESSIRHRKNLHGGAPGLLRVAHAHDALREELAGVTRNLMRMRRLSLRNPTSWRSKAWPREGNADIPAAPVMKCGARCIAISAARHEAAGAAAPARSKAASRRSRSASPRRARRGSVCRRPSEGRPPTKRDVALSAPWRAVAARRDAAKQADGGGDVSGVGRDQLRQAAPGTLSYLLNAARLAKQDIAATAPGGGQRVV